MRSVLRLAKPNIRRQLANLRCNPERLEKSPKMLLSSIILDSNYTNGYFRFSDSLHCHMGWRSVNFGCCPGPAKKS